MQQQLAAQETLLLLLTGLSQGPAHGAQAQAGPIHRHQLEQFAGIEDRQQVVKFKHQLIGQFGHADALQLRHQGEQVHHGAQGNGWQG